MQIMLADCRRQLREILMAFIEEESERNAITDILLADELEVERGKMLAMQDHLLGYESLARLDEKIAKLSTGIPLQYVLGSCYFYGKRIAVGSGVFIPRSDTEVLVDAAAAILGDKEAKFVDICAGSGCISLVLSEKCVNSSGYALELSRQALPFTEKNLENSPRVTVKRFDALDEDDYIALAEQQSGGIDLIVSNPPYIPTEDIQMLDTHLHYEPETALDGGEDGLRFYREIIRNAPILLKPDGAILFEVGFDQAEIVAQMLELNGYSTAIFKDNGGIERVVLGKKY